MLTYPQAQEEVRGELPHIKNNKDPQIKEKSKPSYCFVLFGHFAFQACPLVFVLELVLHSQSPFFLDLCSRTKKIFLYKSMFVDLLSFTLCFHNIFLRFAFELVLFGESWLYKAQWNTSS